MSAPARTAPRIRTSDPAALKRLSAQRLVTRPSGQRQPAPAVETAISDQDVPEDVVVVTYHF